MQNLALPHVLFIPSWYPTSHNDLRGIFFQQEISALHEVGVHVGVIYPDLRRWRELNAGALKANHFQCTYEVERGIPTFRIHAWNPLGRRLRVWLWTRLASKLAQKYIAEFGKPDLIHAYSTLWAGIAAERISQAHHLPYILSEHSSSFARHIMATWERTMVKSSLRNASRITAVSSSLIKYLKPYVGNRPIHIIPNMVDTEFFTPPQSSNTRGFRFVSIAMLNANKGIDVLLRAFAMAFKGKNAVTLEIGGTGAELQPLKQLTRDLGIAPQVTFLGALNREQVRETLWHANAFVLPSYVETFGIAIIEAMATGLPVIVTRCGGPEDFVTPEVGFLVPPGDVKTLAETLSTMVIRQSQFAHRAFKIRALIKQRFGKDVIVKQLLESYSTILGQGKLL